MQRPIAHRYRDKSTGRTVVLNDSWTEFVALAAPEDAEALAAVTDQNVLSVTRSTNSDGVFILKVNSEAESELQIKATIDRLQSTNLLTAVTPALIDSEGITRYALPDRVVVQFASPKRVSAQAVLSREGASFVREFRSPGMYEVQPAVGMSVFELIEALNESKDVNFAEPSYYGVNDQEIRASVRSGANGSDEEGLEDGLPWNLRKIAVGGAWTISTGAPTIVVAVVDGWPDDHPALQGKFLAPLAADFLFTSDRTPSSHATNICGLVCADQGQIAGIAPGVRILPLVVNLRSQTYAERADAIRWVARAASENSAGGRPVRRFVASCSWRVSGDIAVIRTALQEAVAAGVLIVFSAGNDGDARAHYPSDYSRDAAFGGGILCVAATDQDDRRAAYSNYSNSVDLTAPGGDGLPFDERDILCADLAGSYTEAAGTSIAAPHAAAVAALVLSVNPALDCATLKALLKASVDDVGVFNPGFAGRLGTGRLNAAKALAAARDSLAVPTDPEPPQDGAVPADDTASEGDGPSARVDTVTSDSDVVPEIRVVRSKLEAADLEIQKTTGWELIEVRVARKEEIVTLHFD